MAGDLLAHDVAGDGPAVVFIHAGIADRRMWEPQVEPFAREGYRVVCCDLRGYGDSSVAAGPVANVGDVHELLTRLGIDRARLVGCSYGARIALEYALTHPEGVDALILVGPGLRDTDWSDEIKRFGAEEDELLEAGDVDGAVELNVKTWVDGPSRTPEQVDPDVRARVADMQRRAFDVQLAVDGDIGPDEAFEPPASERLHELRCPVLVVVGGLDQPDILRVADQLEGAIPGARKQVIPDAAHLPSLERPDEFNRLALEFLRAA